MKTLVATVTVIGLFALAPAALAQDEHNRGAAPAQGGHPGGPGGAAAHAPQPQGRSPGGGGHSGGPAERGPGRGQATPNAGGHNGPSPDRSPGQGPTRQGANDHARSDPAAGRTPSGGVNAPNAGARDLQPSGRASHNATPARRSADVAALRGNAQATHRFQAGAYRPPQGFVSRHWGYGDRLPRSYFARNYWLTNFLVYGLLSPPPGLVWVRVGPDALLIDEYSGEVVRVQYGVFY
jgi:Ni/Co efflux regulator RcnB